jgi:hypothetical protein
VAEPKDLTALDYLLEKREPTTKRGMAPEPPSPGSSSAAPEATLHAMAASQVLAACHAIEQDKGDDHPGATLSEIDSRLGIGAELLVPVARLLESAGLLAVLETRPFDDHRVTVTDEGIALLAPGRQVELLRQLGLTA